MKDHQSNAVCSSPVSLSESLRNRLQTVAEILSRNYSGLRLVFGPGPAATDGKTIVLPTHVKAVVAVSDKETYQALRALLFHETAHVTYSEPRNPSDLLQELLTPFGRLLENALEDLRVERRMAEALPGTARSFAFLRTRIDRRYREIHSNKEPLLADQLLIGVQYAALGWDFPFEADEKAKELLAQVNPLVEEAVASHTTSQLREKTVEILKEFLKLLKETAHQAPDEAKERFKKGEADAGDLVEEGRKARAQKAEEETTPEEAPSQPSPQADEGLQPQTPGEPLSSPSTEVSQVESLTEGSGTPLSQEAAEEPETEVSTLESAPELSSSPPTEPPDGETIPESQEGEIPQDVSAQPESQEPVPQFRQDDGTEGPSPNAIEEADIPAFDPGDVSVSSEVEELSEVRNLVAEEPPEDKGGHPVGEDEEKELRPSDLTIVRQRGNPRGYQEVLDIVSPYILPVSRKLSNILTERAYTRYEGGHRSGRLECAKLWKHRQSDRLFRRRTAPEKRDYAVTLLIDESGSMADREKYLKAREAAILFSEVLERLKVPFEVIGFSTEENEPRHYLYKEFEQDFEKVKTSLAQISARENNYDGVAVAFTSERLLSRPEKVKVLIVICDGMPCGGEEHARQLKELVQRLSHQIIVVGIGVVGHDVSPFYPNHLSVEDLDTLGGRLLRLLERLMKRR